MNKIQTQFLINEHRQKKTVVIPVEEYEELLEDIHDLAIVAERIDEPTISFDELRRRFRINGLL